MADLSSLIVQGDALQLMGELPDKHVDHVITDPPYEDNAHRNQVRFGKEDQPLFFEPLTQETRVQYALEFVRIARKWILVFCQTEAVGDWKRALEYAGGIYKRTCIWVKPNPQPQLSGDRPAQGHECIIAAYGGPGRSVWNGGGKAGTYQSLPESGRIHPTQKPINLMDQIVQDFTLPGELILDPFAGSGSTLVSCKRYGRRSFGYEADGDVCTSASARLEATESIYDPIDLYIASKTKQLSLLDTTL
jgi:site-specific DNA-methyltransferase (adenine-specific)